ncbi:hypothetical protein NADFUDRAFT_52402 [Nadsonia fulvescens var. elongata DSM 6958]|uniref:VPS37 C-terminal domain-containing protein n=1 Tax=Nadsonia fulvescens var. elongata DSM 6958 TaxID=857566 RepID=A0A1E3PHD3_9ASCO|nr:hypothetical protein NADFUDRAFT_52402 [Nadsonia fulvescens var. elongata DSM 6958]
MESNLKPPPLPPTPVELAASRLQASHLRRESVELTASIPNQLPAVITDKTVDELKKLASNPFAPQIIEGALMQEERLHEKKIENFLYKDPYEQQKTDLETFRSRLDIVVAREVEVLEPLRATIQQKLEQSKSLETRWLEVEGKMYRSLQPFSMPALQSRMEQAVAEADNLSEVLIESFLSSKSNNTTNHSNLGGQGQESAEVVEEFVLQYRKACKLKHLRSERLDRLKENRVGRVYM